MKNEKRGRWLVVDNDPQTLEAIGSLLTAVTNVEICSFGVTLGRGEGVCSRPGNISVGHYGFRYARV